MTHLLVLERVSRVVGLPGGRALVVLDEVDLTLDPGEIVAVVGPSGSGKSTLLAIAGLLDRPTSGEVWVAGHRAARAAECGRCRWREATFGYVFQRFWLVPHLSALENVELPLAQRGIGRRERRERSVAMLARLGLGDRLRHRPAELSGGEQQRVGIARALAPRPKLVVADEPTGSLDAAAAGEVIACLVEAARELEAAVLLATHDERVAAAADRILRLEAGRLAS